MKSKYYVPLAAQDFIGKSSNHYSDFYRYSFKTKGGKFEPKMNKSLIKQLVPQKLTLYREYLTQNFDEVITLAYKPEKLIINSALTPYTGHATTALHSVYGVPYIEGSSIKGLVKSCILQEMPTVEQQEWFKYAFGVSSENSKDKYGQGNIVFLDSFPEKEYNLVQDIQAPHYWKYYQSEGGQPATDDSNPNVFNFYVAENTTFIIQIGILEKSKPITKEILDYSIQALCDYGLGGKTGVGYGLADTVEDVSQLYQQKFLQRKKQKTRQEEAEREKKRVASLSPIDYLHEQIDKLTLNEQDIELSKSGIFNEVIKLSTEDTKLAEKLLNYWQSIPNMRGSKKQKEKVSQLKKLL